MAILLFTMLPLQGEEVETNKPKKNVIIVWRVAKGLIYIDYLDNQSESIPRKNCWSRDF